MSREKQRGSMREHRESSGDFDETGINARAKGVSRLLIIYILYMIGEEKEQGRSEGARGRSKGALREREEHMGSACS